MGAPETVFEEVRRHAAFSDADAAQLRGFRGAAAQPFERIDAAVYERTRHPEDAHAVFADEARIARLQRSLVRWLGRVFGGTYDEAYFDFARPRPLAFRTVPLRELFERAAQLVADDAARAGGVALAVDLPRAELELRGDPAQLEQVPLNLAHNAVEALAGRGGTLTLRARRQPRSVTVEVEDDGPGVPQGSPIFDAFYSTKPQGTGLGLSISHRIVTDHGGTLDVESAPGRTVFRLVLPIDAPRSAAAPNPEAPT